MLSLANSGWTVLCLIPASTDADRTGLGRHSLHGEVTAVRTRARNEKHNNLEGKYHSTGIVQSYFTIGG